MMFKELSSYIESGFKFLTMVLNMNPLVNWQERWEWHNKQRVTIW